MSVLVPTGADVAVDPLDVLLVAPNGSTRTTLYLAQGQPVVIVALPGDVVDELNTAAGLTEGSMFTTPVTASEWPSPIYIAGAQVKRVQSSGATQAGSMVLFALSGFMVTVPTVDLSDMVDLINATTTGGGGGEPQVGYCATNETDNTAVAGLGGFTVDKSSSSWVRVGNGPGEPEAGDTINFAFLGSMNSNVGDVAIQVVLSNLPGPIDGDYGVTISGVNIRQLSGADRPAVTGFGLLDRTATSITLEVPGGITTGGNASWNFGVQMAWKIAGV